MGELINPNDFWGSMTDQDFAIPRVKIGQPTSQEGTAGNFNFNNGKSLPVLEGCKLLAPRKTRVLYRGDAKASRCGSDDFYVPSPRFKDPISTNCMTCYAAQWGEEEDKQALAKEVAKQGNINPPLCKETYNLLMLDESNSPFFIQFQSTQLKEVQQKLFSRLKFEFASVLPCCVQFDIKLECITKPGVKYYSAVFENFVELETGPISEEVQKIWGRFRGIAQDILAKQHADMDAEASNEVPF